MILAEYGHIILILSLVSAVYATAAFFVGAVRKNSDLVHSARNATIATTALLTLAIIALEAAILNNAFEYKYVSGYSSIELPLFYKVTTLWAGQAGSLLLWVWILVLYALLVLFFFRKSFERLLPHAIGTMMLVSVFFIFLLVFIPDAQPFALNAQAPPDGRGLNPLLQHPAMVIHPPILYLGYVGFIVPFAIAIGALFSNSIDNRWVKHVRRWTIVPWFFLGIGILLGGRWAYMELGWGGYWAWDPVENAAFMPWLTGTAFLHSIMIQEKKDMLKVWNVILICMTFILSIFGTFLTRSGVVSSVHSFTQSDVGPLFLWFVVFLTIASTLIVYLKKDLLKSKARIESVVSRESAFLINNVLFVVVCFAVFWGTVFPVITEWIRGVKISVGPPVFNAINIPFFLLLLFLTGVGPLVAWRKSSTAYLKKHFLKPTIAMLATGILLAVFGMRHVYAIISLSLCVFVIATIFAEFHRGARARMRNQNESYLAGILALFSKNKRRYGGYVVHFSIVLLFFGVTGAAFDTELEVALKEGETVQVGRYEVVYKGYGFNQDAHRQVLQANLELKIDGEAVNTIFPQRHYYKVQDQPTTEVATHATFLEDFYVVFIGIDEETKTASFHIYLKPLVAWVWIGGMVLAAGTMIVLLPTFKTGKPATRRAKPRERSATVEQE